MKLLITGAHGFIGRNLAASFAKDTDLRLLVRKSTGDSRETVGNLLDQPSLELACSGRDIVFHCAGYAHAFDVLRAEEEKRHHQINFEGAENVARAASVAGVKRFVFLSSVKAMGEPHNLCVDETFDALPETAYGKAKRAAENSLYEIACQTGMEIVYLRLAMVYGEGSRGNLDRMAAMVRKELFPPLPEVHNKRALVHISDVVGAMRLVAEDKRAAGKTYIVADSQTYSGRQIYDALRAAMGMKPVSWAVPAFVLKTAAYAGDFVQKTIGRRLPLDCQALDRLLGSACYKPTLIESELGWRAKTNLIQGLDYLKKEK